MAAYQINKTVAENKWSVFEEKTFIWFLGVTAIIVAYAWNGLNKRNPGRYSY